MRGFGFAQGFGFGSGGGAGASTPTGYASAMAVAASANQGVTPITQVSSAPPTYSEGAANAASTLSGAGSALLGASNPALGRYLVGDTNYIEYVGGIMALDPVSGGGVFGQNNISDVTTGVRRGGHGIGIRFQTDAPAFDISMNTNGLPILGCITNPATGVRERFTLNDQATTVAAYAYHKWTFTGSIVNPIVEMYIPIAQKMRQITVASGFSVWKPAPRNEAKIGVLWDSYGDGIGSGNTNGVKLTVTDFIGQALGVANPLTAARAGTGYVQPNGNFGTYEQRLDAGSLDISRIGALHAVYAPGSTNDLGFTTDAAYAAKVTATIQKLMAIQPNALIIVCGPQITKANYATQTQAQFDLFKAAVLAASTEPRLIYLDNSPNAGNWLSWNGTTGSAGTYIGPDNTHLNNAGMSYLGNDKMGLLALAAIKARYGIA